MIQTCRIVSFEVPKSSWGTQHARSRWIKDINFRWILSTIFLCLSDLVSVFYLSNSYNAVLFSRMLLVFFFFIREIPQKHERWSLHTIRFASNFIYLLWLYLHPIYEFVSNNFLVSYLSLYRCITTCMYLFILWHSFDGLLRHPEHWRKTTRTK